MSSELRDNFRLSMPRHYSCSSFQKCFIAFLKNFLPRRLNPKRIIYFSDGAASQYKNRRDFLDLCLHRDDFGISAEWHFSATSHGKGSRWNSKATSS